MNFIGSQDNLCSELMMQGIENKEDAKKIINFLEENRIILSESEKFEIHTEYPHMPPGTMAMMIANNRYYVNIKITTIAIIALLLDINITGGVASALLSLSGVPGQGIIKLDESEGEKCIVKETLLQHEKIGDKNILSKFQGECCNYYMNCKYKESERCKCNEEKVLTIYKGLANKNVFLRQGDKFVYQK